MNDYISRVMAIARLTNVEVTNKLATMTDAKRVIAEMPAADVAPVVHGRWIWRNKWEPFEFKYECSICHDGSDLESKYCPNCGANMDGGDGDAVNYYLQGRV